MTAILKIDRGTVEKLLKWKELKSDQSKDMTGEELTVEIDDKELVIEKHKEGYRQFLEISDLNGSFGVWIKLTGDKIEKIKEAIK